MMLPSMRTDFRGMAELETQRSEDTQRNTDEYGMYDQSRHGSTENLLIGEYGQFSGTSSNGHHAPLKVEDLPPQMSSKSNKSRSRMSG
jgi:hypothetical protein